MSLRSLHCTWYINMKRISKVVCSMKTPQNNLKKMPLVLNDYDLKS